MPRWPMYQGKETIKGKTVLITGANTGIGKEAARDLAKRGGRIILACRNMEKAEAARKEIVDETKNEDVIVKLLDLASFDSIREFARDYNETEERLDILINNAGVLCSKMETKDGMEMMMGTNHFGHFLLTNLLLDKVKACAPSRIVIVASLGYRAGSASFLDDINSQRSFSMIRVYCNSKLANILHALELSKRLEGTGVTVNSLHPGTVDTEISRNNPRLRSFLSPFIPLFARNSVQGAQTTLYAALSPDLDNVSAKYLSDCKETSVTSNARNEGLAKRLWDISEQMTSQNAGEQATPNVANKQATSQNAGEPVTSQVASEPVTSQVASEQ